MIKTLKKIYKNIKNIYNNNPSDMLSIISGTCFVLSLVIIISLIENNVFGNQPRSSVQYFIFNISTQLFYTGMMIGLIKYIFKTIDLQKKHIKDIFNYFEILPSVVMASLLTYLILALSLIPSFLYIYIKYGFEQLFAIIEASSNQNVELEALMSAYFSSSDFLLIILLILLPITYISLRTAFVNFYIIDKKISLVESFKKSWLITQKEIFNIFTYLVLLIILNLVIAIISFGFGVLFSFPISLIFWCYCYRDLDTKYNLKEIKGAE